MLPAMASIVWVESFVVSTFCSFLAPKLIHLEFMLGAALDVWRWRNRAGVEDSHNLYIWLTQLQ